MNRRLLLLVSLLVSFAHPAGAQSGLNGLASLGAGYLSSPLNLNDDPSASFLSEGLQVGYPVTGSAGTLKLGYQGNAYQFSNDVELDFQRHALGLEWFQGPGMDPRSPRPLLSAGLQTSWRRQSDAYDLYDHDEIVGYLAFKSYLRPNLMWRGFAGLRKRVYDALPEESFIEPHLQMELKRFSESRTTLGLMGRLGLKSFDDPVAGRVWGTDGTPTASQAMLRLSLAQGLSDRLSIRGAAQIRVSLDDFPYYVQQDIYDSPLLDLYASSGASLQAAVKMLAPGAAWLELGASYAEDDYGEILFATPGGGVTRRDDVVSAHVSIEKSLLKRGRGPVLNASAIWRDQSSNLLSYDHAGPAFTSGLQWTW